MALVPQKSPSGETKTAQRRERRHKAGTMAEAGSWGGERQVELECNNGCFVCARLPEAERAREEGVTKGNVRCKAGEVRAVRAGGIDWLMRAWKKPSAVHRANKQSHVSTSWTPSSSRSLPHVQPISHPIHPLLRQPRRALLRALNVQKEKTHLRTALPPDSTLVLSTLEDEGVSDCRGSCFRWWRGYRELCGLSPPHPLPRPSLRLSAVPGGCLSRPWARSSRWNGPSTNHTQLEAKQLVQSHAGMGGGDQKTEIWG